MGAADPDEALDTWCLRWLGSAVSEVVFRAGSLSAVVGVRLADDREVVVKARRSAPRLQAAYAVHRHVWQNGYPAPEPLVPPRPWGATESASAEQLVRGGEIGGRSPGDAARSAEALAALIAITASAGDVGSLSPSPSWVAWDHDGPGLWPGPDAGPAGLNLVAGPGWLDDAAARCRARLRRYRAPRVVGHADWHADNVLWSDGRLLVVHDWDSVVSQPEAVTAGIAAAIFPASGDVWQPATVPESEQFLSAYIRASTRTWTADDTEAFWAASAWTLAVDAKEAVAGGSAPDLTEAETSERLSRAGA
ncbi:MAG TPA: phosphotransferase [Mycobacteriales bacterium]